MLRRLLDRSTGDIMILLIAATICGAVVTIGVASIAYIFVNPGADVGSASRFIASILNTMIGLLAGYLAGRTERDTTKGPDEPPHV